MDEYIRRCEVQIKEWHALRKELEGDKPIEVRRSNEYAAGIIHAAVTGNPALIYGNVPNNGLIENLPAECIVEVPCHVDRNGIQPVRVGRIPSPAFRRHELERFCSAVDGRGGSYKNRERIYQAALLDPHTSAGIVSRPNLEPCRRPDQCARRFVAEISVRSRG
ncbi:hypothetical protein ACOJBO_16400 [Rhizobium beringeri]